MQDDDRPPGSSGERSAGGETDLYRAAEVGHLSVVEAAIADGMELDIPDGQGRTPIWHAASKGRVRVVTVLAAYGAMLDGVDRFGVSPLTVAIRRAHVDVVRSLLLSGASPDPVDDVRYVPLHVAVEQDAQEIVDLLLSSGADLLVQYKNRRSFDRSDASHDDSSTAQGDADGENRLLECGGRAICLDVSSAEIATLAIVKGNDEVIYEQELRGPIVPPSFELRWDGRKRSGDLVEPGRFTFRLSLNGVTVEMDRRVVRVADISLFEASAFGTGDLVRAILAREEEVDQTGIYGRTPSMLAAAFANVETARVLMTSGASPFAADEEGRSSLDYARIYSPTHEILPMIQSYLDRLSID